MFKCTKAYFVCVCLCVEPLNTFFKCTRENSFPTVHYFFNNSFLKTCCFMESRRVENGVSVVTDGAAASAGIKCVLG